MDKEYGTTDENENVKTAPEDEVRVDALVKCCGTCQLWEKITKLNRPPMGKCTWIPEVLPECARIEGRSMIFENEGTVCETYKST